MKPPHSNNKPIRANQGQNSCPDCGKPFAGKEAAGDLAAHLFQDNYCSCDKKVSKQGQNTGGFMQKLGVFGRSGRVADGSSLVSSEQSSGRAGATDRAQPPGQDSIEDFCPRCGLTIVKASLPGSMTGYLFQDIRCKCPPEADFSHGAMSAKFWQLKKSGLGTTFARIGMDGKQGSGVSIDLAAGAVIGGTYRIIRLIGTGGMGEVYLAEHVTLSKQCALKVIRPEDVTEIGWRRFQQEAKTIAKLDHVNLVKVTDLGIHEGCLPYYAMEFVEGKTLADILAVPNSLPVDTTIKIFIQVCDGVDHAHRAGMIHRDLKPGNIMVGGVLDRPTVKILDFGLVKLLQHDREKQSMTAVGEVFGSPFYMSPEQCSGEKVDNRSDIYSIGCTFFECLTGRPPFTGRELTEIISNHLHLDPPSLESVAGARKIPASLELVVAKLLRKNPVERYQTLTELRNDLLRVIRGESVAPFYVSRSKIGSGGALATAAADDQARQPDYTNRSEPANRQRFSFGARIVLLGAVITFIAAAVSASLNTSKAKKGVAPVVGAAPIAGVAPMAGVAPVASAAPVMSTAPVVGTASGAAGPANKAEEVEGQTMFSYIDKSPVLRSQFLEDGVNDDPSVRPKSESDTRPYSTIVTEGGVTYRVFNFPTDVVIGLIGGHEKLATGVVKFPATESITFSPASHLIKFPSYLRRFRYGEVSGIVLNLHPKVNDMMHTMVNLPGWERLQFLTLTQKSNLDAQSLEIVSRCQKLQELKCCMGAISAEDVARFPFIKHICFIRLTDYTSTNVIMKAIKGDQNMWGLQLDNCAMSEEGLANVAGLPRLEDLRVRNTFHSAKQLEILKNSPNLRTMQLGHTIPVDARLAKVLRSLKKLREVTIEVVGPTLDKSRQEEFARSLPGVQIRFEGVDI